MATFEMVRRPVKMWVIKLIILARSCFSGYLDIAFAPITLSSDWFVEFTNKMKTWRITVSGMTNLQQNVWNGSVLSVFSRLNAVFNFLMFAINSVVFARLPVNLWLLISAFRIFSYLTFNVFSWSFGVSSKVENKKISESTILYLYLRRFLCRLCLPDELAWKMVHDF